MTGRLVVMASGAGTNLGAILDAVAEGRLDAEIAAVVINRRDAGARLLAERAGIPVHYRPLAPYRTQVRPVPETGPVIAAASGERGWAPTDDRRRYDADLAELVGAAEPDLVVLAGWMHLLSSDFLGRFPNRVINLHPALPGQFPGSDAIADAWEAFRAGRISRTGVMVHYVPDEGVDSGPPIASVEVAIGPCDTLEALRRRIRAVEHELIVRAIAETLSDRRLAQVPIGAGSTVVAHPADLP
ncbi:MAG: phosphoribosylglycinamide formyltransferase [bacterium]|nr:phosphoribosylglycinamide formyltransferase [bacterium]MXV89903.1 phosphoribosylglycinamide formyltransferase [Acidimicrobiia bacterium]MYC45919.1 phosphoribosylglycinamide formyltransferase [Acidimicrobiia bacterium]MYI19134.1 phosphoribosylglycinamide formyltransferase [Acidimicrobiia bacterium]